MNRYEANKLIAASVRLTPDELQRMDAYWRAANYRD